MQEKLWYTKAAENWNEALAIGNAKLGAMVFGGVFEEELQVNEESVWSGAKQERNNPSASVLLGEIRKALAEENPKRANLLAKEGLMGIPDKQRVYQLMGHLDLDFFNSKGTVENYKRELDLRNAEVTVSYTLVDGEEKVAVQRQYFANKTNNVIVIHIQSSKALGLQARLRRKLFMERIWSEEGNTLAFQAGEGITYTCMLRAKSSDSNAEIHCHGEYLRIEDAKDIELYLTAATSFGHNDTTKSARLYLDRAMKKGVSRLREEHLEDYQKLYSQTSIQWACEENPMPTDQRLLNIAQNGLAADPSMLSLYCNYAKYLLIASSRSDTLPATLQGIWCEHMDPPWGCKFTININTQMNYWHAEMLGLGDCHHALFKHLERMYPNGVETAKIMYQARGWVAHHNTNIWGDTAPQDTWIPASTWVLGAAWLCTHIWEHYAYTKDLDFLAHYRYLIEDACLFFLDYLCLNKKNQLVINPSVSPENSFFYANGEEGCLCEGCSMDTQILRQLFTICLEINSILPAREDFAASIDELRQALAKLPETTLTHDGRIMEWLEDYEEVEKGHRHISHLYGLYPGEEFLGDERLLEASEKTLRYRLEHGGGHTGWSRAWIMNFWARLAKADEVHENAEALLTQSTYPNLFDKHPPFQIDGNFGGAAGILRAILDSTEEVLYVLPALPRQWGSGEVKNLRAKAGLLVDISFNNGALEKMQVRSKEEGEFAFQYKKRTIRMKMSPNQSYTLEEDTFRQ